jgi:hypothetical protein
VSRREVSFLTSSVKYWVFFCRGMERKQAMRKKKVSIVVLFELSRKRQDAESRKGVFRVDDNGHCHLIVLYLQTNLFV